MEAKNIAIGGTGSRYGVYRLDRDLQSFVPDLAFIEYVVNDPVEQEFIHRYVDALIHKLRVKNPDVVIVYVATTASWHKSVRERGDEPSAVRYAREIADLNGVHFVDAGVRLWDAVMSSGGDYGSYLPDGVHPNDAGHEIYFTAVKSDLESVVPDATGAASSTSYLLGSGYANATIMKASEISDHSCGSRDGYLVCEQGQYFRLLVSGPDVGIERKIAHDGGQMDCSVEGHAATVDFWDRYALTYDRVGVRFVFEGLSAGPYMLECRTNDATLSSPEGESAGTNAYIKGVLLVGSEQGD